MDSNYKTLDEKKLDVTAYNSGYNTLNSLIQAAQSTADGKVDVLTVNYTGAGQYDNPKNIQIPNGIPVALSIHGDLVNSWGNVETFVVFLPQDGVRYEAWCVNIKYNDKEMEYTISNLRDEYFLKNGNVIQIYKNGGTNLFWLNWEGASYSAHIWYKKQ